MEYMIPTQTTEDERRRKTRTAILPIGSFEQHGTYLPLATDTIIACIIANALANSYPVQHLPPISITCSHEHAAWPGTVSISASTLYSVIFDIRKSLQPSGIPNLVLINAHGGNYLLKTILQESALAWPSIALFLTSQSCKTVLRSAHL